MFKAKITLSPSCTHESAFKIVELLFWNTLKFTSDYHENTIEFISSASKPRDFIRLIREQGRTHDPKMTVRIVRNR